MPTDQNEEPPELLDALMANGFMLEVFMLQLTMEMARSKPDPAKWSKDFVNALHERIDANELRMDDRRYPVHELARRGFDRLGETLALLLALPKR